MNTLRKLRDFAIAALAKVKAVLSKIAKAIKQGWELIAVVGAMLAGVLLGVTLAKIIDAGKPEPEKILYIALDGENKPVEKQESMERQSYTELEEASLSKPLIDFSTEVEYARY